MRDVIKNTSYALGCLTLATATVYAAPTVSVAGAKTVTSVVCSQAKPWSVYDAYGAKDFTLTLQADGTYEANVKLTTQNNATTTALKQGRLICQFSAQDAYLFSCNSGSRMAPSWLWSFRQSAKGFETAPGVTSENFKIQAYKATTMNKGDAVEAEFDFSQCVLN